MDPLIQQHRNAIKMNIVRQFQSLPDVHCSDDLEKGMRDVSHLQKKTITNSAGHQQTVYVLVNHDKSEHHYKHGDKVHFEHKGQKLTGEIKALKHNEATDKYGTAHVKGDDGKHYSKSLRGIVHRKSSSEFKDKPHWTFGNNPSKATVEHYSNNLTSQGIKHNVHYDVDDSAGGYKNNIHVIEFESEADRDKAAASGNDKSNNDSKEITMDTPLTISENDRITGSKNWDHKMSLKELKSSGWSFSEEDLEKLKNGETVKDYSPNGRRVLFVKHEPGENNKKGQGAPGMAGLSARKRGELGLPKGKDQNKEITEKEFASRLQNQTGAVEAIGKFLNLPKGTRVTVRRGDIEKGETYKKYAKIEILPETKGGSISDKDALIRKVRDLNSKSLGMYVNASPNFGNGINITIKHN